MAKMRGIKPETFTDDKILQISPLARWLFIGMWTQACDNGHVEDNPVQLKVRLLPMDNCDMKELVGELVDIGLVKRIDGHLSIPNLPHHQKIDRRFLVFCEACESDPDVKFYPKDKLERSSSKRRAEKEKNTETEDADAHSSGARRALVDEGEGEGEGEGEYISNPPEQETIALINPEPSADASDRFDEFWEAYPKRTGQNPKKPARQKFEKIIKEVDPQTLIDAAHAYARSEKNNDPKFIAQTQTWLNQERWNDEYSEPAPQPFDPWNTRNLTASQRRLQEGYEREQRILNGELSFDNPDNPYLQPRPARQAIEGGSSWTNKQP